MPARLLIYVCDGPTCGQRRGSERLLTRLRARAAADEDHLHVERETCFGLCQRGPNVMICDADRVPVAGHGAPLLGTPGTVVYSQVTDESLDTAVDRHLAGGIVATPLSWRK